MKIWYRFLDILNGNITHKILKRAKCLCCLIGLTCIFNDVIGTAAFNAVITSPDTTTFACCIKPPTPCRVKIKRLPPEVTFHSKHLPVNVPCNQLHITHNSMRVLKHFGINTLQNVAVQISVRPLERDHISRVDMTAIDFLAIDKLASNGKFMGYVFDMTFVFYHYLIDDELLKMNYKHGSTMKFSGLPDSFNDTRHCQCHNFGDLFISSFPHTDRIWDICSSQTFTGVNIIT